MHFRRDWLPWLEKRLRPAEQQRAEAHLKDCAACRADLAETRDLVDALAALPLALEALPWHKESLWPAIRAGLYRRPPVGRAWRWATGVSLLLLLAVFSGVWPAALGISTSTAPAGAVYVAQPPGTAQGPATPSETTWAPLAPLSGGQPMATPLPAPAQTPAFSGLTPTRTVAPGG